MNQTLPALLRASAIRWLGLALCLFLLSACDRADDVPRTQNLDPNALLQLRFLTPGQAPEVELTTVGQDDVERENVEPLQAAQLDETHAVLLTHVRTGQDCHACPGVMGAYFYERDAKGWRLTRSHDALLAAGVKDHLGSVAITALEGSHHVATIEWGSCWQGYCGTWLVLVHLHPNEARELGSIATSADNDGAHGACSALDEKQPNSVKQENEEEILPHDQVCYQVNGEWKFQGKRLLVDFTGRIRELKDEEIQPPRQIRQRTVYEVQADALKLVEGENPVPAL